MVKMLHDKGAKAGLPISGTFELTQRCNFNCDMCYVHDANKKADPISAQQWLELGRQAKQAGMAFLLLTGGEPLIRKDFDEIYEGLIKMGFLISINSNGSLIDKHIELFKKYPPVRFNISIYGADDCAYNNLCHAKSYDKVINNIKLLRENNIDVKINLVVTPANKSDYKKIIDITEELKVPIKPTAYAYPAIRLGKIVNEARLSAKEAAECTIDIFKIQYPHDTYIKKLQTYANPPEGNITTKIRCRAGACTFWVTADGVLSPCGMLPEPTAFPFKDGFEKAWDQIKNSTKEINLPNDCVNCKYAGYCIVCAAMCKAETNAFDKKPEYICEMMQHLNEIAIKKLAEEGEINEN